MHLFRVQFTMKLSYRTLPYDEDGDPMPATEDENTESSAAVRADRHHRTRWDDDCPWIEWYSADDPVKGEMLSVAFPFPFLCHFSGFYCSHRTYDNKGQLFLHLYCISECQNGACFLFFS